MRISAQLYTVRQVGDLASQLDLVKTCGFTDVETIGFHGLSPQALVQQVQDAGLKIRSAHFDWEEFEARFDEIVDLLTLAECPVVVMPWLAPDARPGTSAEWKVMAEQMAHWARWLAKHDIRLAYHNHDFDLIGPPGETPLDLILSHEQLHWQPDIGWLAVSVSDPTALLRRYADRVVSVHAKDAEPTAGHGDERWRNLGQGVVNWPEVLQVLAASPCADLFVEHDETPDHAQTLTTGRDFLSTQLSPGGR